MRKRLFLVCGILLLTGCKAEPEITEPETGSPQAVEVAKSSKLYPDVTVTRLLKVIDGDTFRCYISQHCAIAGKNISIRLKGINTPELRSKNEEERKSAILEKQRLSDLLDNARVIELRNIDRDKYFRIDADVYIDGEPLLPKLNPQYLLPRKGVDK